VQIWYSGKGDTEEKSLKKLHTDQRAKIEEIKKKTNFYSTRSLIERYDVPGSAPSTPQQTPARLNPANTNLRKRLPPGVQTSKPNSPLNQTPIRPLNGQASELSNTPNGNGLLPPPPQPLQPHQKQWYDKLADALLGDDPAALNDARLQYALICENCFLHNGLAREGEFEEIQYICPKCGHFNPSRRAKREKLLQSESPERRLQVPPSPHTPTPLEQAHPPRTPEPHPTHQTKDAPQADTSLSHDEAADRTSEGMDVDE